MNMEKFELVKFSVEAAEIEKLKAEYMPLKIEGIKDVAGYTMVHQARMEMVHRRTTITKEGKAWRDQISVGIKKEQAEEKRLLALIEPIETHLYTQERAVDDEKARIKAEAEEKEKARIQGRINRLFALGCKFDGAIYRYKDAVVLHHEIPGMSDQDFEQKLQAIETLVNQELAEQEAALLKQQEEEKKLAEEKERLAAIAREQAKKEAEMEAEADRIAKIQADKEAAIAKEQTKIEAEKRKLEEDKRIEAAKKEAAEKARIETEARLKREAEDKARREAEAKAEAICREAMRPDKEKLLLWADKIAHIEVPEITSPQVLKIKKEAVERLYPVVEFIKTEVKKL